MEYYIKELNNGDYELVEIDNIFILMLAILGNEINGKTGYIILNQLDKKEIEKIISEELEELTDQERKVLRLRYGLDDGCMHTLQDIAKKIVKTQENIRQIENNAFRKLKYPRQLSYVKEMIRNIERKPISYPAKFKDIMMSELVDFVFKNKINQDTLLYHILNKQNIEMRVIKFGYPLELTINDIGLSIRSYNCLMRANIRKVQDLINLSDDDLIKIRNLGQKSLKEIRTQINKLILADDNVAEILKKTEDAIVSIEIDIVRNGDTTTYKYSLDTSSLSCVPKYLFEELFPDHEKSLYNESHSYFSTYVNEFLLFLGYVDLDQVFADRHILDKCLYDLNIVEDKQYITKKYLEYNNIHAIYYSISHDIYQELREEINYIRTSKDFVERDIQDEMIRDLLNKQVEKDIKSKVS